MTITSDKERKDMQPTKDFLSTECFMEPLTAEVLSCCAPFSCGDRELDEFFRDDVVAYERERLGSSYCFRLRSDPSVIVCAFTLSNTGVDGRRLPNARRKKVTANIPHQKHLSIYPSMLLARIGVNTDYGRRGIGSKLIAFIREWILNTKSIGACRFMSVDAYNAAGTIRFYESTGFQLVFSTEGQERENLSISSDRELKTCLSDHSQA
jgi:GNAT superfamily N-acetyltransferase